MFWRVKTFPDTPMYRGGFCYISDIKGYASVIENRLDDEWRTKESVLEDNAEILELAQKHNANYILIDDKYEISIDFK